MVYLRKAFIEGFVYLQLLEYIKSKLIINEFVCANIHDLYTVYLTYLYNSMEFKKQTNNIESTIKTVKHFVNQGPSGSFTMQGVIPKRQFGGSLEKILKTNHPYINRKQCKTLVLQGVRLKAPVKKLLTL